MKNTHHAVLAQIDPPFASDGVVWVPNVGWADAKWGNVFPYRNIGAETEMARWARLQPNTRYVRGFSVPDSTKY